MRPVVVIVGLLSLTSSACFLTAGIQRKHNTCSAEIQQLSAPDPAPPSVRLDGTWQCQYTGSDGSGIVENLTLVTNGSSVTMTGRNSVNENVTMDGKQGGKTVTFSTPDMGLRLLADPGGRLLDGKLQWWGESVAASNLDCMQSRYICRKR